MKRTEKVKKVLTKICSKCGEEKPATTEYFGKDKRNTDGLERRCKDCRKEYNKQYYKENKQYMKQWRQENKEHIKKYNKKYYEENKEKMKECQEQWRQENKEYNKKYYEENKEKINEYKKQWGQENTDSVRQRNQKRRALKKRLPHTLTLDQWEKIKDDFNNKCAYCGITEQEHREKFNEQLHQEHFIPLSKGGEYTHNNIIPACRNCNSSKCDTNFFEWYPTYEHYDKQREIKILKYINNQKGDEIYGNAI